MVENTHAPTHIAYKLEVEDIFDVSRAGENDRFAPFATNPNRMLLWHGLCGRLGIVLSLLPFRLACHKLYGHPGSGSPYRPTRGTGHRLHVREGRSAPVSASLKGTVPCMILIAQCISRTWFPRVQTTAARHPSTTLSATLRDYFGVLSFIVLAGSCSTL